MKDEVNNTSESERLNRKDWLLVH